MKKILYDVTAVAEFSPISEEVAYLDTKNKKRTRILYDGE